MAYGQEGKALAPAPNANNNVMIITQNYIVLKPAYGRDYSSKAAVEAAFRADKDFEGDATLDFKLCSIRDFAPGVEVCLRYRGLRAVAVVTV